MSECPNVFYCTAVILALVIGSSTPLYGNTPVERLLKKPDAWFRTNEGHKTMSYVLSWQSEHGDWPKNEDTTREAYTGDRGELQGTFDNGATIGELRVVAKAFGATQDIEYKKVFLAGLDHILESQYPNGGWPQHYPLSQKYHRHITFNDDTMIHVLDFLRDVASSDQYKFVDRDRLNAVADAVHRGIECILKCQVIVDGQATVWCAQHDATTLTPVDARSYELASLSGAESAGILKFLMSIPDPTPEVINAVDSGVDWFESVKIEGFRYERTNSKRCLTVDPSARPLWARFYEIETFRPLFCDRDGIVKYDIEEIGPERRGGYTWYGHWGESLLNAYAKWPHH